MFKAESLKLKVKDVSPDGERSSPEGPRQTAGTPPLSLPPLHCVPLWRKQPCHLCLGLGARRIPCRISCAQRHVGILDRCLVHVLTSLGQGDPKLCHCWPLSRMTHAGTVASPHLGMPARPILVASAWRNEDRGDRKQGLGPAGWGRR